MFEFSGSWQKEAAQTKTLPFDGVFITLYTVALEKSQMALRDHAKSAIRQLKLIRFAEIFGTHVIVDVNVIEAAALGNCPACSCSKKAEGDKPPIEELRQFLEFQLPRQWAPVFSELPLGPQRRQLRSASLQFNFMGPKLCVNTTQVVKRLRGHREFNKKSSEKTCLLTQKAINVVFSTAADGQSSVEINVLQGEREFVRDNKSLGGFRLDGIPPAPRGVPQIEVKFDIDANGILSVTAVDKGTGKKQDITITGASTLPNDEVERMVKEAEKFASEDKEKRDAIDTKNQADSVVNQTEKQLKEPGDKVPGPVKEKVEAKLGELKDAISGGST
ncbi:hypothetical protein L6164_016023 [Bauhinia variegata]|uniref:Uncharacterized protein n=1 Tax=Bauhinia variegata TaxID=167791 RepID=A0ACB9NN85_BAUVA|nr:hypothetical protein L6164_016023 [Bauhinia variegata]